MLANGTPVLPLNLFVAAESAHRAKHAASRRRDAIVAAREVGSNGRASITEVPKVMTADKLQSAFRDRSFAKTETLPSGRSHGCASVDCARSKSGAMGDVVYLVSEKVFHRASPVEVVKSGVVKSVTGGVYVVQVEGEKGTREVPIGDSKSQLARRFAENDKVLITPLDAIEIGKKDKKPKGVHAVVSNVDKSSWPVSYMIKEDGKSGHKAGNFMNMVSLDLALLIAADEAAKELVAREDKERDERESAAKLKAEKAAAKKAAAEEKAKSDAEASKTEAGAAKSSASAPPGFETKPPPGFEQNDAETQRVAAKAAARAKARAEQEALKAARAAAEKEAKNKVKKEAQKVRKAAEAAERAIKKKEEAAIKAIQDKEEAAKRVIREKEQAKIAQQQAARDEKEQRKLAQEVAAKAEKEARAVNEQAAKKAKQAQEAAAKAAARATADESDAATREEAQHIAREAVQAAADQKRAAELAQKAAEENFLASKSKKEREKLREKEAKQKARRAEIDLKLKELGVDEDLLSLATPGVMRVSSTTTEDDSNETMRRRKNNNTGKKTKAKTKKGSRLIGAVGAADKALREEASGAADLQPVYMVCAVLFLVLAAVLVWAYNTLL
jgi:hypothetical protein